MDPNRMTQKSLEAMQAAQGMAREAGHSEVDCLHLALALVQQNQGLFVRLLERLGLSPAEVEAKLKGAVERLPSMQGSVPIQLYLSSGLQQAFVRAQREAKEMGDEYVSVEHLVVAFVKEKGLPIGTLLKEVGVAPDALHAVLNDVRGNQRVTTMTPESTYEVLERYGMDLVDLARKGKLDPVIGRDTEIRRTIRILSRKTKNNPVLIGEPGVGKTAIVEGLNPLFAERRISPWAGQPAVQAASGGLPTQGGAAGPALAVPVPGGGFRLPGVPNLATGDSGEVPRATPVDEDGDVDLDGAAAWDDVNAEWFDTSAMEEEDRSQLQAELAAIQQNKEHDISRKRRVRHLAKNKGAIITEKAGLTKEGDSKAYYSNAMGLNMFKAKELSGCLERQFCRGA